MATNHERDNMAVARRAVQRGVARAVLNVAVATGTIFAGAVYVRNAYESHQSPPDLTGDTWGDEAPRLFVTDRYNDQELVLVRSAPSPSDGDLVGYAKPGSIVEAQVVYGPTYPSGQPELGGPIDVQGRDYGKWYQLDSDQLTFVRENGSEYKIPDKKVYVSGNFLKSPPED